MNANKKSQLSPETNKSDFQGNGDNLKFVLLDPESDAGKKLLKDDVVMGINVNADRDLITKCIAGNINPQHPGLHIGTYDNGGHWDGTNDSIKDGETAMEFAVRQKAPNKLNEWTGSMVPHTDVVMATTQADLDSIGAMAVLNMLSKGENINSSKDRIALVSEFTRALSSIKPIMDVMNDNEIPINEKVYIIGEWIKNGKIAEEHNKTPVDINSLKVGMKIELKQEQNQYNKHEWINTEIAEIREDYIITKDPVYTLDTDILPERDFYIFHIFYQDGVLYGDLSEDTDDLDSDINE